MVGRRILLVGSDSDLAHEIARVLESGAACEVRVETGLRDALSAFHLMRPELILVENGTVHLRELSMLIHINALLLDDALLPVVVYDPGGESMATRGRESLPHSVIVEDAGDVHRFCGTIVELLESGSSHHGAIASTGNSDRGPLQDFELMFAKRLAVLAECRDHPETGHVFRVGALSGEIAREMQLSPGDVELITHASPLHDIGQLAISDAILLKDDLLSLEEMDIVKTHTSIGAALLNGMANSILDLASSIARYHHENWDGTGYTPGVEGESIPLAARIVRVADSFDAMTTPRPFAKRIDLDSAIRFIRDNVGRYFDPAVVEAFLQVRHGRPEKPGSVGKAPLISNAV